jgi:hypothetical protein
MVDTLLNMCVPSRRFSERIQPLDRQLRAIPGRTYKAARMNIHRNAVLVSAIGLALAAGVVAPDAPAREKENKQQAEKDRGDRGKGQQDKGGGKQNKGSDKQRGDKGGDKARAEHNDHRDRQAQPRRDDDRRAEHAAIPTVRPSSRALEVRQREEAHARNAVRAAERERLITLQQRREAEYRRYLDARRTAEQHRIAALREQRRAQQYAYQQWYWQQQRAMQARWTPRDYDRDPYFHAPLSYRYVRDGRAYEVNRYAAGVLEQAVRYGYEMGVRAGNADRIDGWRSDWRNNYAYQDAGYGYNGYYVDRAEYNHYFRQGFQRGYQDAYGNDYRYGRYDDGNDNGIAVILASVLQSILGLQQY